MLHHASGHVLTGHPFGLEDGMPSCDCALSLCVPVMPEQLARPRDGQQPGQAFKIALLETPIGHRGLGSEEAAHAMRD